MLPYKYRQSTADNYTAKYDKHELTLNHNMQQNNKLVKLLIRLFY